MGVNNPVHFLTSDKKMSLSALIPFCEFGGDMSSVGVKIDQFDFPVCNIFQAKVLNDQLCYEVDLNNYSSKANIDRELKYGFNFIMDYNEDRQVTFKQDQENKDDERVGLVNKIVKTDDDHKASIYLDTIGIIMNSIL